MKRWRVSSAASMDAASCADDRFPRSVSSSYPKRRTASRTPSGSSRAPHAEAGHNDRVRPPFPTKIPPLLSEFLNKRRSKMTFPLKKIEELGLDRPAFTWAINLSYRGPKGGAAEPGDLVSAYATIPDRWLPQAAAARGAGLVQERDGRWHLTERGRGLAQAMHESARAHYATLAVLPNEELSLLARLLDRAFGEARRCVRRSRTRPTGCSLHRGPRRSAQRAIGSLTGLLG